MSGAPSEDLGPGRPLIGDPNVFPATQAAPRAWDALARFRRLLLAFARHAVPIATALTAAALLFQIQRYERDLTTVAPDWAAIAFVAACVAFLSSAVSLATRRLLAPIALSCGVLVLLSVVSVVKYSYVRASLYILDFYNYATLADLSSLYRLFPRQLFIGIATLILAGMLTWLLFVLDETRVPRRRAAMALGITALSLAAAFAWRGPQGKLYHFFGGHHVSSVLASVPEAFLQGGFLDGADKGGRIDSEPLARLQNADADEAQPTIIAILHESSFPTDIFPIQCGGRVPGPLYTSSDGNRYDLRVETYNGATWMTEYGLLLGLSTYYLGDNRIWIGHSMENRIRDSLPQQLHRNGYDTLAVYPSPKSFVNTGNFYKSIGFDKLLDLDDLKAPTEFERDRYYYQKVVEQIRAHRRSGSKSPLFVFAWTNTTHAPYDDVAHPGIAPDPGTVCAKDKPWAEYIRRLLMSEDDLAWLNETLKAEFPGQPFMILGYGDHHPLITEEFLEPNPSVPFTPVRGSIGYKTFFRITGVNFEPDWSVVPESVDTPFLGNVMMLAARLPRYGFYNDRDKLMALCRGRYSDCPYQDEILSFHERLMTSGTVLNR